MLRLRPFVAYYQDFHQEECVSLVPIEHQKRFDSREAILLLEI